MGKLHLLLRKLFAVLCIACFVVAVFSAGNIFVVAGPPPGGNWIVNGTESYSDQTIVLNGNLIVDDGGDLTFRRVTLKLNCTYDGEYSVSVFSGGKFYVLEGSIITSVDPDNECWFFVHSGSTFRMNNSELHECGSTSRRDAAGLMIRSDDAVVENSLISHNIYGICVEKSGVVIRSNNITANEESGIDVTKWGSEDVNPTIYDNYIGNNKVGISVAGCSATIYNNTITSNSWCGFVLFNANPIIRNNLVTKNGGDGVVCRHLSAPTIFNNTIASNLGCGVVSSDNSNVNISNNDITSNLGYGWGAGVFCNEHSNVMVKNNTIAANWRGVVCQAYSTGVIQGNNIKLNNGPGVTCWNHSNTIIQDNTIVANGGGVVCSEHCSPRIASNTIALNNGGGIQFNHGCAPTIVENNITSNNFSGIDAHTNCSGLVYGNIITNNANWGIGIEHNCTMNILRNILTANVGGIFCGNHSNAYIQGNMIRNSTWMWGIALFHYSGMVEGNLIIHNEHGILVANFSSPLIQGNMIISNKHEGVLSEYNSLPEVHSNNIYGNGDHGVVNKDSSITVNATHNYWGSPSGPAQSPPDAIDPEEVSENVLYNPWLAVPIVYVDIGNPLPGETVSATVTVSTQFYAVNGVSKVEFYIDDQLKHTDFDPPYEWDWDTTQYAETSHEILVEISDSFGLRNRASRKVLVDNTSPTVSIKEPLSGTTCYGMITISVNATDNREVSSVRFRVDGEWLIMPYNSTDSLWKLYAFDTTTLPDGQHTLMALALDRAGNPATTSITVLIDNNPPRLMIQSPASGMTVGLTLTVDVQADDVSNITKVEFYLHNVLVYTAYTTPYQWAWDTTRYPNGQYTITVKAYDAIGNITTRHVTVNVNNVEAPWWQTNFWTIVQALIALGALILGIITFWSRTREKKKKDKE